MQKGSILDIAFVAIIVLGLSLLTIFSFILVDSLETEIDATEGIPDFAKEKLDTLKSYFTIFDIGVVFLFTILAISTIILARSLPTHPVYFVMNVIAMIAVMFITYVVQTVYLTIAGEEAIIVYANQFPLINALLGRLPYIALGLFVLVTFAMFIGGERIDTVS